MILSRRQMFNVHVGSIGAGIANAGVYCLHGTTFAYGSKLVHNGEMRFDQVLQYRTLSSS